MGFLAMQTTIKTGLPGPAQADIPVRTVRDGTLVVFDVKNLEGASDVVLKLEDLKRIIKMAELSIGKG